jgi:hypothetical protein
MSYEGDHLNFDYNPEYTKISPLNSIRKKRIFIFKTINNPHIAHGSPPINIDLNASEAGENESRK